MDAEKITRTINTAIGCVMASGINIDDKRDVTITLREIEEKLTVDLIDGYSEDEE